MTPSGDLPVLLAYDKGFHVVGNVLGAYKIVSKLGEGGMGTVFLGQHARLDRRVAIKVLRTELSGDQAALSRFLTEARATSLIRHPNIVEVFDCDIDAGGRAYITMELLEGETLAALLMRQGPLAGDLGSVVAIAMQTAAGLAAAHAKAIVHRDLKPENIVLTADSEGQLRIKLVDFGIAKLMGETGVASLHQTRTGALVGTPLYMAPEQARGTGKVDARSDIYSFGCIIFAMLTGAPPFVREGVGDLVVAHITEPAPELEGRIPGLPPQLAAVVRTCLAKDPAHRPQDMRAVERELRVIARAVAPARLRPATTPLPSAGGALPTVTPAATAVMPTPQPQAAGGTLVLPEARSVPEAATGAATSRTQSTLESGNGQVGEARKARASGVQRWLKIAVPAGVLVLGVAILAVSRSGRHTDGASAPAAMPAPAPRPAAPAPVAPAAPQPEAQVVTIQLRGLPVGAVVSIDGEPANPPLKLPRNGKEHAVRARAAGYSDAALTVRATSDQELTVDMQRLPSVPTETAPAAKHKAKDKRAPGGKRRPGEFRGFGDL